MTMRNRAAVLAGLERTKRPCTYCGRVIPASGMTTHEPACSPEAREARRERWRLNATARRRQPGYRRPPEKRDACPACGGSKVVSAGHCKACDAGGPRVTETASERFWRFVDRRGPDECWPWIGAVSPLGYGRFHLTDGSTRTASRFALEEAIGPLPAGHGALHRCDNPPCCNPAHLFAGTQLDNNRDMIAKGRAAWQRAG